MQLADMIYISNYAAILFFLTAFFFKYNTISLQVKAMSTEKNKVKNLCSKKNHNFAFIKSIICCLVLFLVQNVTYRGFTETLWNNHILVTEFSLNITNIILIFSILIFYIIYNLSISKMYFSIDFLYATALILLSVTLLFVSNTFITFYFFLELSVCLTFFKFAVSRFWFRNPAKCYSLHSLEKYTDALPKAHINVLFFQYWISFFSSILLLFFFINLEFYFSSTEWTFINLSIFFSELPIDFYFYFFLFIIGFFLKIGLTPFHLYKLEVYKGLPFITIFIYTIVFFLGYFLYFSVMLLCNLNKFFVYYWLALIIILIIGIFYVLALLFDINFIKNFFAYSTIINIVTLLCIVLSAF